MDFFQGSLPPNFISFCLEQQNVDEPQVQSITTTGNSAALPHRPVPISMPSNTPSPPPFPPIRTLLGQTQQLAVDSPFSNESNVDVTAYADEMVQRMEVSQELTGTDLASPTGEEPSPAQDPVVPGTDHVPIRVRTSTPTLFGQPGTEVTSISQLESSLSVAPQSQSGFPELQLAQDHSHDTSAVSLPQSGDEASSSVHEPPPLPGGASHFTASGNHSDTTQAVDTTSQSEIPLLYAGIPFGMGSATETQEDSGSEIHDPGPPGTSQFNPQPQEEVLRDLSGRSRATLKQYFEAEDPYTFPVGQRVVAFTEPQVYHLLRVLTDEAINMTCTTMERMVLGAVKGTPLTAPSRTKKFQTRAQVPSPGSNCQAGTSSDEFSADLGSQPSPQLDLSTLQDVSGLSYPEDSDSTMERLLIDRVYNKTVPENLSVSSQPELPHSTTEGEAEIQERSSLDCTLSELRDRLPTQKSRQAVVSVKKSKSKRMPRRGVPMREEFFSKIAWTRSFISGPADPLHNPHMVWCHMCKKNFSIKTKGTVEILRHHRTEKHLRRDQRWRYEHLKTVDDVTGKVHHRVRGRDGKILNKSDLAQELPKFIHTELVDVGERHPFYEDYLKGHSSAPVTPQSRLQAQICLLGDFVQDSGNIAILRRLWARAGSYTGFQSAFQDFDWSEDHIMVSSLVYFIMESFVV